MSLWLCLRFPLLPLQCQNPTEAQPVVVLAQQRVLCANDCAAALGIQAGMEATTSRALAGGEALLLLARDRQAERQALQRLCHWAYGITPTLHPWREDCLQLEIGGCLALFRGLEALLAEIHRGLVTRGYRVAAGLAPNPKAAWLLSFSERGAEPAAATDWQARLATLPLALLDDFPREVAALQRAGLQRLGEVLALPEAALARRCGAAFVHYLRQVQGREADLQESYQPPARFSDQHWFGYEVRGTGELLPVVRELLQGLCRFLRQAQQQTATLEWQLVGVDRRLQGLTVRSGSRHSDPEHWYQLTRLQLEALQLRTGIEGVILACEDLVTGHSAGLDLFSPRNQRETLQALLDRLRSRLGLQAVHRIGCRDEHLPELALHVSCDTAETVGPGQSTGSRRPFWLLPEPRLLPEYQGRPCWRQEPLQLVCGPERIEDHWWRLPTSRDYYIARGNGGQYYWLFRDRLRRQWYLHGVFA